MKGGGVLGPTSDPSLDDLEDEEVIAIDETIVRDPAFQIRMAITQQRSATISPASAAMSNRSNLSTSRPEQFPMSTTRSIMPVVGMLITHSPLARIRSKLWFPPAMTQPTREGENSITVCQPIVMTFRSSFQAELTRTIGPGSR